MSFLPSTSSKAYMYTNKEWCNPTGIKTSEWCVSTTETQVSDKKFFFKLFLVNLTLKAWIFSQIKANPATNIDTAAGQCTSAMGSRD